MMKKLLVLALIAVAREATATESSRTQSGTKQGGPPHDHRAKLGQLRYTRSQYSFVAIALFSMKFIAPPSTKKSWAPTGSCRPTGRRVARARGLLAPPGPPGAGAPALHICALLKHPCPSDRNFSVTKNRPCCYAT
jgi:hypothetical protein